MGDIFDTKKLKRVIKNYQKQIDEAKKSCDSCLHSLRMQQIKDVNQFKKHHKDIFKLAQ